MDVDESAVEGRELKGTRPPLLRVLADAGVASEEELRLAFAEGMGSGKRFGEVVLRHGWLDEAGLAQALAQQWRLPYIEEPELDRESMRVIGANLGEELGACPVHSPDGRLQVAVAEPSDERFDAVRAATAAEPAFAVVTPTTLARLLEEAEEVSDEAEPAATVPLTAAATEADRSDSSLGWLDRELDAATAQLTALRERVTQLIESDQRSEHELAACLARVAELIEVQAADQERIRVLEQQLARQQERITAAQAKLNDASRALDE